MTYIQLIQLARLLPTRLLTLSRGKSVNTARAGVGTRDPDTRLAPVDTVERDRVRVRVRESGSQNQVNANLIQCKYCTTQRNSTGRDNVRDDYVYIRG
jgi:hypothetical protein